MVINEGQRQPPADKNGEEFYIRVRGSNGTLPINHAYLGNQLYGNQS